MDSELLPRVFELFTQATRTPDRTQGGLGLGLALVDSLARMQGGRVSAYSGGLGCGSRFVVVLPVFDHPPVSVGHERRAASGATPAGPETLSIMVVDDNTDAADMLAAILRLHGHLVSVEYSSTAALRTARDTQSDLYVLDIGLPDLDGYSLVKELRAMLRNADAVFVALTGYGQAHDKILSKSAGFDYHLVKPVDIVHLDSIVRAVADGRPGNGRQETVPR
ncbi:response regulator [Massilia aerilata]|uniref:histidine kinase n=1 Tax=Massilia aerilata TaxID=453817 RepID=A0ABW0RXD3_9BURK